ncbi:MAG: hypothetical protein V8S09_04530 [Lactobacillus rogosae]
MPEITLLIMSDMSEDDIKQQLDDIYVDGYYDYTLGQKYEDKYYEDWSTR